MNYNGNLVVPVRSLESICLNSDNNGSTGINRDDTKHLMIDADNDIDGDIICGDVDNCPNHFNPNQFDSYPPETNNCGDACECEGNFDGDEDVDGTDASMFKTDFGRGGYVNPCSETTPCKGDFLCDGDVDGADAALFKADFGRGGYVNPCPYCSVNPWCVYP